MREILVNMLIQNIKTPPAGRNEGLTEDRTNIDQKFLTLPTEKPYVSYL